MHLFWRLLQSYTSIAGQIAPTEISIFLKWPLWPELRHRKSSNQAKFPGSGTADPPTERAAS